jgi:L-alanine-DL-glutamate epimerase-like enolase superfamily enzyme
VLALPRCAYGVESHGGPDSDPLAHGLFNDHPELRDGFLHIGAAPGFGLDPDWRFVERYLV